MKSKHFKAYELVPKKVYESYLIKQADGSVIDNTDLIFDLFDEGIITAIDWIKENIAVERSMIINNWKWVSVKAYQYRGLRTPESSDYTPHSMHNLKNGKVNAIDFHIKGLSAGTVRLKIFNSENVPELLGIKRMENVEGWVHIDNLKTQKKYDNRRIYLFNI